MLGVDVAVDLICCYHASNGGHVLHWVVVGPVAEPVGPGDKVFLRERVHLGLMTSGGWYGAGGPGVPPWGMEGKIGRRGVRVTAQGVQFPVYPEGTSRAFVGRVYLVVPRPQVRLGIYGRLLVWFAQVRGDLPSEEPPHSSLSALRQLTADTILYQAVASDSSAEDTFYDSGDVAESGSGTCIEDCLGRD